MKGKSLRLLRVERGLTQQDIEAKLGIPQPRYSAIERGTLRPTEQEQELLKLLFFRIVRPSDD